MSDTYHETYRYELYDNYIQDLRDRADAALASLDYSQYIDLSRELGIPSTEIYATIQLQKIIIMSRTEN